MITTSIVFFSTPKNEVAQIIEYLNRSIVSKIYIIDNSPTDELRKFVNDISTKVIYIHGHGNIGYGAGHNICLKKIVQINSTYHLVINSDITFNPDIIQTIADYMDRNIGVGLLMPKVFYPNGEIQYLCKLLPMPLDLFSRRFLPINRITNKIENRFILKKSGYNKIINPPCLSGCFLFLRMSILKEHNLFFDERFFMYFEDFDLVRRFHRICRTIFYPDVSIIHNHARQSHTSRKMLCIFIRSLIKYFAKYGWFFDQERKEMNSRILNDIDALI